MTAAACGQQGPLYLPDDTEQREARRQREQAAEPVVVPETAPAQGTTTPLR